MASPCRARYAPRMRSRARAWFVVTAPLLVLVGACDTLVPPDPLPSDAGVTAVGDAATDADAAAAAETSTPPPVEGGADASADATVDAAEPCPNAGALDCATSGAGRVSSFVVDPMKCASPKLGTKGCENWCAQRNEDANPDAGAATYASTCVAEPDAGISGAYRCSCSTN